LPRRCSRIPTCSTSSAPPIPGASARWIGDQAYHLDLLFYHLKLRCYVVVELKAVAFDPAFVGQMNLYLSAADDLLRHPDDKPTIGLLLCRAKNRSSWSTRCET